MDEYEQRQFWNQKDGWVNHGTNSGYPEELLFFIETAPIQEELDKELSKNNITRNASR